MFLSLIVILQIGKIVLKKNFKFLWDQREVLGVRIEPPEIIGKPTFSYTYIYFLC